MKLNFEIKAMQFSLKINLNSIRPNWNVNRMVHFCTTEIIRAKRFAVQRSDFDFDIIWNETKWNEKQICAFFTARKNSITPFGHFISFSCISKERIHLQLQLATKDLNSNCHFCRGTSTFSVNLFCLLFEVFLVSFTVRSQK